MGVTGSMDWAGGRGMDWAKGGDEVHRDMRGGGKGRPGGADREGMVGRLGDDGATISGGEGRRAHRGEII